MFAGAVSLSIHIYVARIATAQREKTPSVCKYTFCNTPLGNVTVTNIYLKASFEFNFFCTEEKQREKRHILLHERRFIHKKTV